MTRKSWISDNEKTRCGVKTVVHDTSFKQYSQDKHTDALSRHVQTVTTDRTFSNDLVRAEQENDKLRNTPEIEKLKGNSEYLDMCLLD